ncbi:MAG: hypothetical protein LBS58_04380, partial [Coriobacteriales bacterium]|nr:hypothetical protein [Coriobacteriales bacterium]
MSAKKTMPAEGAGVPPKAVAKTNAGPNTRLSLFLQSALPDFLLVLVISTALVFTVSYGFNSAAAYRGNVALVAVLVLPLIVALFAGSWSKKALIPSAVAVIAVAVAYIGISIAIIPSGLDLLVFDTGIGLWTLNDVAGSYVIFAFILIVVPILAYLLSRRGALLAILVVLGLLACGTIQFLYRDFMTDAGGLWAFLFALLGMAMMFTYQSYRQSIYQAKRVRKVAFFGAFGFSALISAVFVAIGLVVFYVVIASLGLTTPEIKPFQEFWAQPEIALSGTTQDVERPDDE